MGRAWRSIITVILSCLLLLAVPLSRYAVAESSVQTVTSPVTVSPSVTPLVSSAPDIIVTAFVPGDRLDVIELYNQSGAPIWMGDITIRVFDSGGKEQSLGLKNGYLLPRRYITFAADTMLVAGALSFTKVQQATASDIAKVTVERKGSLQQSFDVPPASGNTQIKDNYAWAQHRQRGNSILKQTGDFMTDFVRKTSPLIVEGTELYLPKENAEGLKIVEVNANPNDCEPGAISALNLVCSDYIKVINSSMKPVNLTNYRLRAGAYGDSPSISNTFNWQQLAMTPEDEYMLDPGAMTLVHYRDDLKPISMAATGKYVWLEDYFGTTTYDSVHYPDLTLSKYQGYAWAYDQADATWKAGIPSPLTVDTIFPTVQSSVLPPYSEVSALSPCGVNQYRSIETNRCRSIVTTTLAACKDGQYRSEETNRCRSIVQAVAASLKPCSDDQFRNPATGRCKKIASVEDIIQPCDAGWERNLDTNRCRKIKATNMPVAQFPVENMAMTTTNQGALLATTGVVAGAFGYALWEWRREFIIAVRTIVSKLTLRK